MKFKISHECFMKNLVNISVCNVITNKQLFKGMPFLWYTWIIFLIKYNKIGPLKFVKEKS